VSEATPPPGRRRGLGRGLGALLASTPSLPVGGPEELTDEAVLVDIPVDRVMPNPEQPRREVSEASIAELAESVRAHGLLQPLIVERSGAGFRLVAGERRLRAARLAGLPRVPAIVRPAAESARHSLELALVENLQRTDLSPLEEASAFARLADTFGLTHEAVALRVGRTRAAVSNTIRLLALPAPVQEALHAGRIGGGHARALLSLETAAEQETLAREIEEHGLTVRQVEQEVNARLAARGAAPPPRREVLARREPARRPTLSADDEAVRRGLEEALGTPVALERRRRGGGRLAIEFFSDDELAELYRRLGGRQL